MKLTQHFYRRATRNFKLAAVPKHAVPSLLRQPTVPRHEHFMMKPKHLSEEVQVEVQAEEHHHLISKSTNIHMMAGFSSYSPSTRVLETIFDKTMETSYFSLDRKAATNESNAFFVVDLERVAAKYLLWQNYLPTVIPHYAVKANPNRDIVRLLAALGSSFDCATLAEIKHVLSMGVDPSRIIFANPCKPMSHIVYAREHGVLRTTFDSEAELAKIKIGHPKAHLVLRLWVDDRDSQCQLSNKYGASVEEALVLLNKAKELGLNVVGVSFHCGSGASAPTYRSAMRDAKTIFQAGRKIGFKMSLLDIGGGMPGTEGTNDKDPSLKTISSIINPLLEAPEWRGVEAIAEPGRYFCAEAQTLAVQIIGKRVRNGLRTYYVNDGLYQSFNCILYDHSTFVSEEEKLDSGGYYKSAVFGQTCDGMDQISKELVLPDLRVGDWLVFPSMGAYTNGASSQFNGFDLSEAVVLPPTTCSDDVMKAFEKSK